MFGKKYFFSRFWNMIWDFMQFAQHANFWFDMSQLNLNNFWTDRATELRLDSKVAFFQAISEYDFIALRFSSDMFFFKEKLQIRLFFYQNCIGLVYRVFKIFIGLSCIRFFNWMSKSIGLKSIGLCWFIGFLGVEPNFLKLKNPHEKNRDQINTRKRKPYEKIIESSNWLIFFIFNNRN